MDSVEASVCMYLFLGHAMICHDTKDNVGLLPGRGKGEWHIKRTGGCSLYILGVKKAVLVPLRVFSLKSFTAGVLSVPFRVLSRNNMTGYICQLTNF